MSGESKVTTDHDAIRRWAEERGGQPATVQGTAGDQEQAGILRIDFPGYEGAESLEPIAWDEFFEQFEESDLAFVYQDETSSGEMSRFCKFVDRTAVDV
ncbi:MAG: hypothetical protein GXY33_00650 [Phycisphaerae bacterium]|nr:hypothetical protein [Phycisphaerae bacterium]